MPARTIDSSVTLQLHRSARDVPPEVCAALGRDPRSNIILPKLESCRASESRGYKLDPDEFWIVCSTRRGSEKVLDFMLSCTYGITGKYPVFIYSPKSESDLTRTFIDARVELMVAKLLTVVSTRRVYSVFANDAVARSFASCWKTQTGISAIQKPYYAALFSLCTPATLTPAPMPNGNLRMRPALPADAAQIAVLCRGFAEESEPFILDDSGAMKEAKTLIARKQVWVLETFHARGSSIACIAAITRTAASVTAVTKVYTPPEWRQNGFARRLVREVCRHLFEDKKQSHVVLYVGHGNSAANVYHRVGFTGLDGSGSRYKNVENWTEIGFDRNEVDLGHW